MPNRLAESQSLYLRKHATNPVDWWPWCDEALAAAEAQNKPIFLSVGYSSCHWCTVMEGEAFSDEQIADYLNDNFLPIKVDREERPDIDSIYMQALQMIAGQGGWPLNIFLTPGDRIPFYGGTYFSVEPRYGRPGFLQVLQALRQMYDNDPAKITNVKGQILNGLQQAASLTAGDLPEDTLLNGVNACIRALMPVEHGTRFPMIPYARLVHRASRLRAACQEEGETAQTNLSGTAEAFDADIDGLSVARKRALDLVTGGIFDHVGGGFHRYTVDATWTVPHFEKMLYDNGLILEFLAECWLGGEQSPAIARAVGKTVEWLMREMRSPQGYFYAAQDADNFVTPADIEPEEGHFYTWTTDELQSILTGAQLSALSETFDISASGNFEGRTVLQRSCLYALGETTTSALQRLFYQRYGEISVTAPFPPAVDAASAKETQWPGRIPPVTDTKMIVAWNALMISGLAKSAITFNRPDDLSLALEAAQFCQDHQIKGQQLYRLSYGDQPVVTAQAEDYALLIKAYLDVQQACLAFEKYRAQADAWKERAITLQSLFDQHLDSESGGYRAASSESLIVQEKPYQDSALPAANGIAVDNLVRLCLLTQDPTYLAKAEDTLKAFSDPLTRLPQACPSLLQGLDSFQYPLMIRTTAAQLNAIPPESRFAAVIKLEEALPERAIALVCRGLACLPPIKTKEQMQQQIDRCRLPA